MIGHFKEVTAGIAQGSIPEPQLWNASYDGILRMDMPENIFLVGYADDLGAGRDCAGITSCYESGKNTECKAQVWAQINRVVDKAVTVTTALNKIMANTSGDYALCGADI